MLKISILFSSSSSWIAISGVSSNALLLNEVNVWTTYQHFHPNVSNKSVIAIATSTPSPIIVQPSLHIHKYKYKYKRKTTQHVLTSTYRILDEPFGNELWLYIHRNDNNYLS